MDLSRVSDPLQIQQHALRRLAHARPGAIDHQRRPCGLPRRLTQRHLLRHYPALSFVIPTDAKRSGGICSFSSKAPRCRVPHIPDFPCNLLGYVSTFQRGRIDPNLRNARVFWSHRPDALYQGTASAGPSEANEDLGFSPCAFFSAKSEYRSCFGQGSEPPMCDAFRAGCADAGAKAQFSFFPFTARLKSCPDTKPKISSQ
jgi:hypothetical protein